AGNRFDIHILASQRARHPRDLSRPMRHVNSQVSHGTLLSTGWEQNEMCVGTNHDWPIIVTLCVGVRKRKNAGADELRLIALDNASERRIIGGHSPFAGPRHDGRLRVRSSL